ncbi:MAG: pseudaminic acid synthase [Methanobacteriales archaeon HGW-Methanobacteriales-1]|jgi:pseudaminic acid synthase|nr:MAG: pseudaminic acid synthase [Methanobacteriales archaeon HGW-Methanobacteriales-1]
MNFKIDKREIGENKPVFIIAELSANHLGDFDLAVETIKSMKESGADAIKMQTYTPDTLTLDCNNKYFKIKHDTLWDDSTFYQLYNDACMPWEWQPKLKKIAEKLGLIAFSSPFDKTSVDFLEDMDMPAYKIASFEITDIPLIEYVASTGKPVIISTGIAEICDIELAVKTCKKEGNDQISLLKCTSSYPAPFEEINLNTIPNLKQTFNTVVGLSDHTLGNSVSIASVALGAKIIEKHFILDRTLGGPDAEFSLEPEEFKNMVESIREVEKALGKVTYDLTEKTKSSKDFSRSLFVVKNIKKGEKFTESNVKSIRPGFGLHPKYLNIVIGKKASNDILKGTPLNWNLL